MSNINYNNSNNNRSYNPLDETHSPDNYIQISIHYLPLDERLFPFHLFTQDSITHHFNLLILANNIFTEASRLEIIENEDIFPIFILKDQIKTFELFTGISIIKNLSGYFLYHQKKFNTLTKEALLSNDFNNLIKLTAQFINGFSESLASEVSLCKQISKNILTKDNTTNRIVAIGVTTALMCDIDNPYLLADLINASFFHHIGYTNLPYSFYDTPYLRFQKNDLSLYQKHPEKSANLIRSSQLPLGDSALEIILDHHEFADGTGYPNHKTEKELSIQSLILSFSSYVIEYSEGRINGNILSLEKCLKQINNEYMNYSQRRNLFGSHIHKVLTKLL